jgi:hypothetical protein
MAPVTDAADFLARAIPIMLGGGAVQIAMHFLKRRQDMRAADVAAVKTTSDTDAVVVASAERSLLISDQVRDRAVRRAELLMTDLQHAEAEMARMQIETREYRLEVAGLRREVEYLRGQLADAQEQLAAHEGETL